MITPSSIAQGRIFWLTDPFKDLDSEDSDGDPVDHDLPETVNGIERGVLGHPVMVLHTLEGTTDVAVCLVSIIHHPQTPAPISQAWIANDPHAKKSQLTTLKGRDLDDRRHTYQHQYNPQFYLAIHPTAPPCPFVYPQLHLMHDRRLQKAGYLSIRRRYTVPLSMLEHRGRDANQLTPESFAVVAGTFAMEVPTPVEAPPLEATTQVPREKATETHQPESKATATDNGSIPRATPCRRSNPGAHTQHEPPTNSKSEPSHTSKATAPAPQTPPASSPTKTQPDTKPVTTLMRRFLASGGFKELILAALAADRKMTWELLRDVGEGLKARVFKRKVRGMPRRIRYRRASGKLSGGRPAL